MSLKEMWTGLDCLEQRQMVNKCRLDKCAEDKHRYQTVVNVLCKCGLNSSDQDNKGSCEHINETAVWVKSWDFYFPTKKLSSLQSLYVYFSRSHCT